MPNNSTPNDTASNSVSNSTCQSRTAIGAIKGAIGYDKTHDSAHLHVTGQATYTDDIREPAGCLHAYILKSPHAHARIINIDVTACCISGVHAVLTYKDIPGQNDVAPAFSGDPIFAEEFVEYAGQSVLAVIADDIHTARKATKLAVVDYDVLPAILTTKEAIAQNMFVGDTNIMETGDIKAGFSKAEHILDGHFKIGGQDHFYLEGQIALAIPEENNEMLCWSSTQHPSEVQHLIAKTLNRQTGDITVKVRRAGGAFGGKESQASLIACVAALGADKTQRPVKLRLDRDDDMILTGKRHGFDVTYKVGFDQNGMIQSLDITHAIKCGMSPDLSNAIADRAIFHSDNCYFLPNAKITSYRCKTHTVSDTAFRGFGGPQGMLVIEYIIDHIAHSLNRQALEIRKLNLYDAQGQLKDRSTTHYGMPVEDNVLHDLIPKLETSSNYQNRVKEIDNFNAQNTILKKGIALTPLKFGISFTLTLLNQAGALVHIYKDGSLHVNHGGVEMGQGLHTKIAQIVAQEFSIDIDHIKTIATDTAKVPNTSATAASSGTDLNGKAAQTAAITLKNRLIDFASEHFNVDKSSVYFEQNQVHISDSKTITFAELIELAYVNRISLSTTGFYSTPKIFWDNEAKKGRPFLYFAYGAAVTEVIIDTLTGEYNILRSDILHDVGKSLNPAIDIGQIEGGFIQGNGWLTSEELWWDDKGVLKTHAPSTYKIPTGRDIPDQFNTTLYKNENQEDTVHKSKAVGEPPLMLAISTFFALKDAISAARGKNKPVHLNAPATPEAVLKSINKQSEG